MPFSTAELAHLGKVSLDAFMRNNPIDQIATERPWLKCLMKNKSSFAGGKQFCVEQLRVKYDSNYQAYFGSDQVTYNKRKTVEQANFSWGSVHDGFSLNEDEFTANGVTVNDNVKGESTKNERVQLTALFKENMEVLRLGFEEQFDYNLHLDGTQGVEDVAGLDHLISLDGVGTVGGINATTSLYWRNNFVTSGVVSGNVIDTMEVQWRACTRYGGRPDKILVGQDFLDLFRNAAKAEIARYTIVNTNAEMAGMDPAISNLHFNNVPLVWDPVFADLDDALSPTIEWEKRCYFINSKSIKYRPIKGHEMVTRKPPRQHDRYEMYWGLTNKYAVTINKRNANAVIAMD